LTPPHCLQKEAHFDGKAMPDRHMAPRCSAVPLLGQGNKFPQRQNKVQHVETS